MRPPPTAARRTPDDLRVAVDRLLARAFPGGLDAWESPRELAVGLALREGLTAEEALARCGVCVPSSEGRAGAVAFGRLPYGAPFRLGGVRYRKVTAKAARHLTRGAPNATALDGDGGVWLAPNRPVEPIPTERVRRPAA